MKTGQISGDRDVIAFTDPSDPDTSASIVFSAIPAGAVIDKLYHFTCSYLYMKVPSI
jgi:hypothetical protein